MPRQGVERPILVRAAAEGGYSWTCLGYPTCPGIGRERSQIEAVAAGVDHLRTGHRPTAMARAVAA
jgi:hypothetical protein